jgi:NACalpha-BTF3-like transcription factor
MQNNHPNIDMIENNDRNYSKTYVVNRNDRRTVFSSLKHKQKVDLVKNIYLETSPIIISQSLIINGNGYIINGQSKTRCFHINNNSKVVFNDLTISNCYSHENGGGIYVQGDQSEIILNDCLITSNTAKINGGGIYFESHEIERNTEIRGTRLLRIKLYNTIIESNIAESGNGGGMFVKSEGDCHISIKQCSFIKNMCYENGGGLYLENINGGHQDIKTQLTSYNYNTAKYGNGGGYYISSSSESGVSVIIQKSTVAIGNLAGLQGGGFYIGDSDDEDGVENDEAEDEDDYEEEDDEEEEEDKDDDEEDDENVNEENIMLISIDLTCSHNTAQDYLDETNEIYFSDQHHHKSNSMVELSYCNENTMNNIGSNAYIRSNSAILNTCKKAKNYNEIDRGTSFSSKDKVRTKNGKLKYIKDLSIGEYILTSNRENIYTFSPILFLYKSKNIITNFIEIKTIHNKNIYITPSHLLPTCSGELVSALDIIKGSCLLTVDGHDIVMKQPEEIQLKGTYTVITENEFIIINGIIASPFSWSTGIAHGLYID